MTSHTRSNHAKRGPPSCFVRASRGLASSSCSPLWAWRTDLGPTSNHPDAKSGPKLLGCERKRSVWAAEQLLRTSCKTRKTPRKIFTPFEPSPVTSACMSDYAISHGFLWLQNTTRLLREKESVHKANLIAMASNLTGMASNLIVSLTRVVDRRVQMLITLTLNSIYIMLLLAGGHNWSKEFNICIYIYS